MRIDLRDDNDVQGGTSRGQDLSNFAAESIPYLQEEELTLRQLFMARGFRTHDGYWGAANEAHCFEELLDLWLPKHAVRGPRRRRIGRRPVAAAGG